MIDHSIPVPLKHVYRKTCQADPISTQLKEYQVLLGIRTLTHGDMDRVDVMTDLLVERRLLHV